MTIRGTRITIDKYTLAFWFGVFVIGFFVIGLSITLGISNQVNNKFVSVFNVNKNIYTLATNLETNKNNYYVVASIKGDRKRSRIISTVVDIQGFNEEISKNLLAGDLRSVDCERIGFCKKQILKGFSIEKNGKYNLKVSGFKTVGAIEILSLSLHSNHSYFFQAAFIVIGVSISIAGIIMTLISLGKIGYNKFLGYFELV